MTAETAAITCSNAFQGAAHALKPRSTRCLSLMRSLRGAKSSSSCAAVCNEHA